MPQRPRLRRPRWAASARPRRCGRRGSPVPRGPRNHLRPVAVRTSQPIRSTSHLELPDALARIDEEGDAVAPARCPRLLDRVDQPTVGAHVGRRAQGDPTGRQRLVQGVEVERPVGLARHHLDGRAGQLAHLEESEVMAVVGDCRSTSMRWPAPTPPPRAKAHSARAHPWVSEPVRTISSRPAADQTGRRSAHALQAVGHRRRRLVAAPLRLEPQMVDLGSDGCLGGQGRPGVVEVDDGGASRRRRPLGSRRRWCQARWRTISAPTNVGRGHVPGWPEAPAE